MWTCGVFPTWVGGPRQVIFSHNTVPYVGCDGTGKAHKTKYSGYLGVTLKSGPQ